MSLPHPSDPVHLSVQDHMLASQHLRSAQLSLVGRASSIKCISLCRNVASHGRRATTSVRVFAAAGTKSSKPTPSTAASAVEAGLKEFADTKDYNEAVRLFKAALDLKPSSEEAAAALFNLGCAYAKLRNFKGAAEAIGTAINEHNLKLTVALKVGRQQVAGDVVTGEVQIHCVCWDRHGARYLLCSCLHVTNHEGDKYSTAKVIRISHY